MYIVILLWVDLFILTEGYDLIYILLSLGGGGQKCSLD